MILSKGLKLIARNIQFMVNILFISDYSHGWARVKIDLLKKLGIEDKISSYSYINGNYVYLEEDCDASILLDTLKERKIEYKIQTAKRCPQRSHIRKYQSYVKPQ